MYTNSTLVDTWWFVVHSVGTCRYTLPETCSPLKMEGCKMFYLPSFWGKLGLFSGTFSFKDGIFSQNRKNLWGSFCRGTWLDSQLFGVNAGISSWIGAQKMNQTLSICLTAKAPENGWLEDNVISFWGKLGLFSGGKLAVSLRECI